MSDDARIREAVERICTGRCPHWAPDSGLPPCCSQCAVAIIREECPTEDLRAKVDRLTSRGIEDLHDRVQRLEAENERLRKDDADRRFRNDQINHELERAAEENKRLRAEIVDRDIRLEVFEHAAGALAETEKRDDE